MGIRAERLLLIDANSLLSRAFYALPALTTRQGIPTNAVYGLALMLGRLIEEEAPHRAVAAFDTGAPTFRHASYEPYKAHRPRMPDPLREQLPLAKELLEAYGILALDLVGYEADDVIGTLATLATQRGMEVLIVTGDKDALQLVGEHVQVLLTRKGITEVVRFDPEEVVRRVGVAPRRIPDLKGLTGDPSDNIPGVPGIGEKTALRLLERYERLEELVERRDEVPGRAGEALRRHWEKALLSKRLATIRTDAPVSVDWERLPRVEPDCQRLADLFIRLEFRTLLESLGKLRRPSGGGPTESPWDGPVEIATTLEELSRAVRELSQAHCLAVCAVWDGPARAADLVGIGLAGGERALYVPVGHSGSKNVDPAALEGPVRQLLCSRQAKACHDAKAQRTALDASGLTLEGVADDTMLAVYLLDPDRGGMALEDVALRFAGVPLEPLFHGAENGRGRRPVQRMSELPPEKVAEWAIRRARAVLALSSRLAGLLKQDGLDRLYREVELPLSSILFEMEQRGVSVDVGELRRLAKKMEDELIALESRAYELAGETFNLNSPRQLARILFEKLGLAASVKGKGALSTSAEVLESLVDQHEIVQVILDYRRVHKLKSGYVDALPKLIDARTGRIHTTFHQAAAATGRLSSANPNLQNIPVRSAAGQEVRKAFVARPGWVLLKADYSQIELRVLAHLSGDPGLIEAFRRGEDIHAKTAAAVFGVDAEEVTPRLRSAAKAVNFGVIYGISGFGLARGTGLSHSEAESFIENYFQRHPSVRRFIEETIAKAREKGYVVTLFGRRRYLPGLMSRRWQERTLAERMAVNAPIQGSAADIIKAAMLAVHRRMRRERFKAALLLQVHDELLFEVPHEELSALARIVKDEMEGVVKLTVPLVVELAAGPNWLEGREVLLDA